MGFGSTFTRESLIAESANMSPLGAEHTDPRHWADMELPLPNFMLASRAVLRRCGPWSLDLTEQDGACSK